VCAPQSWQMVLQLGEDLLDRIEVGTVREQVDEFGVTRFDGFDAGDFVAGEVVQDHDIAFLQHRCQGLLDPSKASRPWRGLESGAVDRTVEDAGRGEPVMPECSDEGRCCPMSVWCEALDPLAFESSTVARRHIGRGPGFIEENQAFWS